MGWIESRDDKHRGVFRDATGKKQHSRWLDYLPAAMAWLERHEPAAKFGMGVDPRGGAITLREWEKVWWPTRVVEPTTAASDRGRMDKLLDEFGDYPIGALSTLPIQSWASRRIKAGAAAATVRKYVNLLSACLAAAVLERKIPENPCHYVSLPPPAPHRDIYLTREQVDALDEELGEFHGTVAFLLAYSGLRWGELAGLHVDRIDWLRRGIQVTETLAQLDTKFYLKPYPKGFDRRFVALPSHVMERLSTFVAAYPQHPCGLSVGSLDGKAHARCKGLLFTVPRTGDGRRDARVGGPLSRTSWNNGQFKPAALKLKLPTGVRPHDLRHTFGSWLVQEGVPLREVQGQMGHKSMATTERYAHLAPDVGAKTRAALERPDSGGTLGADTGTHAT